MNATLPKRERFQQFVNGKKTDLVVLQNSGLTRVAITNYGARLVSLLTPDKRGQLQDVIVGFDSIGGYLNSTEAYYGATVGRCANRIRNGQFRLDGMPYQLTQNKGRHHLHGGAKGFGAAVWAFEKVAPDSVTLFYQSSDGEEGYPGMVQVRVTYTLTEANALNIAFWAQTDKPTIVNLTNHAFFNLNGLASGDILNHTLYLNADAFTLMDEESIATGEIALVDQTPFDFRIPHVIGARIDEAHPQLENGNGYDHNFVLRRNGNELTHAATAVGDQSGIRMDVYTTEPGMQFYTGNFMDGSNTVKGGGTDARRTAFCLETQHFPDAPNHDNFPSIVSRPGETYSSTTTFQFAHAD